MKSLLAVCFAITLIFTACKKEKSNIYSVGNTGADTLVNGTATDEYDFDYTGDLHLLSPVTFNSTLAIKVPDEDITWDFGDGTYDTGNTVRHRFMQTGTLAVIMHVKNDKVIFINKSLQVTLDASRLSGIRHWSGYYSAAGQQSPEFREFDEEVKVLNDSTVSFHGTTLTMYGAVKNGIYEIRGGWDNPTRNYKVGEDLVYFYDADTYSFNRSNDYPSSLYVTSTTK